MIPKRNAEATRSEGGFTLIEVMVSLVLLGVVASGLFTAIRLIAHAQADSAGVDVAQAGVRAALERLGRDLRMVAAGTFDGSVFVASGTPSTQPAILVTNGGSGPDRVDLLLVDPAAQTTSLAAFAQASTSLPVADAAAFQAGDAVLVTDWKGALLLQIAAVTVGAPGSLEVAAPSNTLPRSWPAGSYVFRVHAAAYFVDATAFGAADPILAYDADGAGPLLPQPIAEGVEDLQIALGCDLDGNGTLAELGAAAGDDEWSFNVAGETAPASLATLRSLRITIVSRTFTDSGGARGQRPAAEDHPVAIGWDGYPRRVLRSEIAVRNFNL